MDVKPWRARRPEGHCTANNQGRMIRIEQSLPSPLT